MVADEMPLKTCAGRVNRGWSCSPGKVGIITEPLPLSTVEHSLCVKKGRKFSLALVTLRQV